MLFGILFIENRKADDLTAVAFQVQHLLNRFVDALGRDIGHGLQNDLVLVADLYVSDHDGPGFCSFHKYLDSFPYYRIKPSGL